MIEPQRLEALLEARYEIAVHPWEHAFVACAQGRFAEAIELGSALLDDGDLALRAQSRLTVGSALRQLGRYEQARSIERVHDLEDPIARAHLFTSQAADAVGLGSLRVAHAALATATQLIEEGSTGTGARRARIRAGWVEAEIALASDAPELALEAIGPAHALSPGWPRHEAKTALFEAVAQRSLGATKQARAGLELARELAEPIGAHPIARIANELLAEIAG